MNNRSAIILALIIIIGFSYGAFVMASGQARGFKLEPDRAQRSVVVAGPSLLVGLGVYRNGPLKWQGCGYKIEWGDGTSTPQPWMGQDCSRGVKHTYASAGVYTVKASVDLPPQAEGGAQSWSGEIEINVK